MIQLLFRADKLLFEGVFALQPARKVFAELFSKSDRFPMRRFLFGNFFFCAFWFKRKSGFPVWVLRKLCTNKSNNLRGEN